MATDSAFDARQAHRHFSAECFNLAWTLIEKSHRTPEEDEEMVRLCQASIWHWTQRDDCTNRNRSIGYWQASRIYAILGRVEEARRYGRLCLERSQGEPPFFLAYAYEALARAEKAARNDGMRANYQAEAARLAEHVEDAEDRAVLLKDLETLAS